MVFLLPLLWCEIFYWFFAVAIATFSGVRKRSFNIASSSFRSENSFEWIKKQKKLRTRIVCDVAEQQRCSLSLLNFYWIEKEYLADVTGVSKEKDKISVGKWESQTIVKARKPKGSAKRKWKTTGYERTRWQSVDPINPISLLICLHFSFLIPANSQLSVYLKLLLMMMMMMMIMKIHWIESATPFVCWFDFSQK